MLQSTSAAIATVAWFVALRGAVAFVKSCCWLQLQRSSATAHSDSQLRLAGGVVQASSFLGSLIMFVLANVLHVFPGS